MSKTQFKRVCMHFLQMKMYSSAVWQFFWLCCCIEIGCSTKRRTICVVIFDEQEYNLIQRKTEQREPSKHHRKCKFYYMISKIHYPNLWQANKRTKVSPCKYDGKEKRPMLGSVKFTPTCFNGLKRLVWGWSFIVILFNQCVIVIGLFWLLLYVGLGQ